MITDITNKTIQLKIQTNIQKYFQICVVWQINSKSISNAVLYDIFKSCWRFVWQKIWCNCCTNKTFNFKQITFVCCDTAGTPRHFWEFLHYGRGAYLQVLCTHLPKCIPHPTCASVFSLCRDPVNLLPLRSCTMGNACALVWIPSRDVMFCHVNVCENHCLKLHLQRIYQ